MTETRLIALGDIAVAKHRLRGLRENTANALSQSMADQGQLQPIVVRPRKHGRYWLVAGLHRLAAARKLKWAEINCTIFDGMAADEAELAEIDENLIRAELSPAEQALHIGKRKELYEKVYPETKKGGAPGKAGGGKKAKTAKLATFARDTATKIRASRRSVERDATRAKRVVVLGEIVDTLLDKGAEIDALAKLPESEQRSIAEAAKRGEQVSAISACKACDAEAAKIRDGTQDVELTIQNLDRLATFKGRTIDPEAVWVCEQLELAWCALRRRVGETAKVGVVDRALVGEKVSAANAQRAPNIANHEDPRAIDPVPRDTPVNSVPLSVQIAANVARIPAFAVGPEQIAARKAALLREENEGIARYAARQRDWQAREARAAQEELKREIDRRRTGGR
jgi:ParB-like chromosome segregation protein Spo0J